MTDNGHDPHALARARDLLGALLAGAIQDEPDWDGYGRWGAALRPVWTSYTTQGPRAAQTAYAALARFEPALATLVTGAEQLYPAPVTPDELLLRDLDRYPTTDAGQAEVITLLYEGRLCYVPGLGWLIWAGGRWKRDDRDAVVQYALVAARLKQRAVLERALPADDRDAEKAWTTDIRWAKRAEDIRRMEAALKTAQTMPAMAVQAGQLDASDHLIGVANGVLDLRSGQLRPGAPADLMTQRTCVAYYAAARAPRWERFLQEVFAGDADLIAFIQRAAGYSLTGETREQCYFQCYGTGANGKSTLLQILRELAGEYAKEAPFTTFEFSRQGNATYDLAELRGARLVLSSETGDSARLNEARIKAVTGGDTVTARFLYQSNFTYTPRFKLWFASNHKPQIRGTDTGIWRRVRLIPFTVSFKRRADKDLIHELRAELPGILAWAVRGALAWYCDGLGEPQRVLDATEDYRAESDLFGHFFGDCTVEGADLVVESAALYRAYQAWCAESGLNPMNRVKFGQRLVERGYESVLQSKSRKRAYRGLGLLDSARPAPPPAAADPDEPDEPDQLDLAGF